MPNGTLPRCLRPGNFPVLFFWSLDILKTMVIIPLSWHGSFGMQNSFMSISFRMQPILLMDPYWSSKQFSGRIRSLKLTYLLKIGIPKRKLDLPTIHFQGRCYFQGGYVWKTSMFVCETKTVEQISNDQMMIEFQNISMRKISCKAAKQHFSLASNTTNHWWSA